MAKQSKTILKGYLKCLDLLQKWTNILDSYFHKDEGKIIKFVDAENNTMTLSDDSVVELGSSGSSAVAENIPVILGSGENVGHYKNGDTYTVTDGMTPNQVLKKFLQKLTPAVFNLPVASLVGAPAPASNREVGETLEIDFTASLSQNDGGAANSYAIKKGGVPLVITNTNEASDTIVLTTTDVSYQATIGYGAGTGTKNNSLGDPEPNTIVAGSDDSNTLSYRGYRAVFYGSTATKKTTSAEIRTLTKRLENSGNTFTLNTGNTNKIFQLWLPTGENLVSVVDLDALNANITSSYISEAKSVNDANGAAVTGTLYTLTAGVPYSTSHRHQITKN